MKTTKLQEILIPEGCKPVRNCRRVSSLLNHNPSPSIINDAPWICHYIDSHTWSTESYRMFEFLYMYLRILTTRCIYKWSSAVWCPLWHYAPGKPARRSYIMNYSIDEAIINLYVILSMDISLTFYKLWQSQSYMFILLVLMPTINWPIWTL